MEEHESGGDYEDGGSDEADLDRPVPSLERLVAEARGQAAAR